MRCLIIDDEPDAIYILERFIRQTPGLELTLSTQNTEEVIVKLTTGKVKVDVAFLDIDMPGISGLELARIISPYTGIVFTTAHIEFGPEAFALNAIDYLVKKVNYSRFLDTIKRARERIGMQSSFKKTDYIYYEKGYSRELITIFKPDIIYVESVLNYVIFHLNNEIQKKVIMTMQGVLELLNDDNFTQIHKSFIVNIDWVNKFSTSTCNLKNGSMIPLGRKFKDSFLEKIHTIRFGKK